jgi:preprotein translocase subunit SecA
MKRRVEEQVQRRRQFAIVDEVDSILIDEARTPLIISGPAFDDVRKYAEADRVARLLKLGSHFEVKEKERTAHLTDEGVREAEKLVGVESFYTPGNMEWPHLIDNALKAHHLYRRDRDYIVNPVGEIVIVDEFTGRLMTGRQWSDGLHQAVEAKERVKIKEENQTLATITLQNFFKLYKKLSGMTGTAMTEANEFWKVYELDVVAIPTNKVLKRVNYPDVIYLTEAEKFRAIVQEIERLNRWDQIVTQPEKGDESDGVILCTVKRETDDAIEFERKNSKQLETIPRAKALEVQKRGRAILVGTTSIEKSELLSDQLKLYGIEHQVLNAKYHEREAEIVAQAGRKGMVTIATNMAGRGTDIILGGNPEFMAWADLKREVDADGRPKYPTRLEVPQEVWRAAVDKYEPEMRREGREVAELGGLHIIGTERHESRRIDNQLRGRSGRQGDPGSSRFFLALEDDLMRKFAGEWVAGVLQRLGMKENEAIESRMVSRRIEAAQKKVEERNFDIRKNLLEYDEVMDEQRKRVYSFRQALLDGAPAKDAILDMLDTQIDRAVATYLADDYPAATFAAEAGARLGVELNPKAYKGATPEDAVDLARRDAEAQSADLVRDAIEENLSADTEPGEWNWGALVSWVNSRFGLTLKDRDLKQFASGKGPETTLDRRELEDFLLERVNEAIQKVDLGSTTEALRDDWGVRSLGQWLLHKFGILAPLEEWKSLSRSELEQRLKHEIREMYSQKEAHFPVQIGLARFLADRAPGGQTPRTDRDGLAQWFSERYGVVVDVDELRIMSRGDIEKLLKKLAEERYQGTRLWKELQERLDAAFPQSTVARGGDEEPTGDPAALNALSSWVREQLEAEINPEVLPKLTRSETRAMLSEVIDARHRPEMREMETALVLQFLDSGWMEHLRAMDHLRSSVGLRGYAQVDPKVEYKREGMKIFEEMWNGVGDKVTDMIFRMEKVDPDYLKYLGSRWQLDRARTIHEAAPDAISAGGNDIRAQQEAAIESSKGEKKAEPVRNTGKKVGRNDPCPCGSGRKYKVCCLRKGADA